MEKRFKNLSKITVKDAEGLIPSEEDLNNNLIRFYTISPSIDVNFPSSDGWEDVKYYTQRPKKSSHIDGIGDELVYILSNPSYPGMYKIGYTTKDIETRVKDLSKATGVPTPFKVEYIFRCLDGLKLEEEVHKYLKEFRTNNYREFFEVKLDYAKETILRLGGRYN